ncbi:MAG: gliding motility-associated ABC transporter substrate-binding protein GldG [Flavobacterium sp.]|nr:gliding motility-associated ABC transporter substrate-binding protein GldG [Flavobacterium sp.]
MMETKKAHFKKLLVTIAILVAINFIGHFFFKRLDLTGDQRYTLSETSLNIIKEVKEPLYVDVFLEGNFPGEFRKLQTETRQLLEEFKAYNSNIVFDFVNPLEEGNEAETMQQFLDRGLTPLNVTVDDKGKQTQEVVFPWAVVTYGNKSTKVPLLKNMMGASTAEKVVSSVQHLEYAFANGFNTVSKAKEKKVAIIKGNGEMHELQIADFLKSVRENYYIGPFTLDSVAKSPQNTIKELKKYDLAIIAKPTESFSDEEKQVLDQFIIHGGKTLWLIDQVAMEMDSLYTETGSNLAYPRDLGLNDMFFKYGIRIKPDLIKDLQASPIALATGKQGTATQYTQFPWLYSPAVYAETKHPIVSNLDVLKFEFTNPIEVLKNDIKKTILLQSSKYSKAVGTPIEVSLDMVGQQPDPAEFAQNQGGIPLAVLLEGNFHSMYENRVLPFDDSTFSPKGKNTKMIVISDGDVVKNQLDKDFQPLELGFDKWTNKMYANKEFMMNCVNYLLDDNGLINIRNKEVDLPLLDKEKVYENYTSSQIITVGLPIVILSLFGIAFTFMRKRKYSK